MGTLRYLYLTHDLDPDAPLVQRLRLVLHYLWRGEVPVNLPDMTDPPVVGRRVTDEAEHLATS
jgi:hypothetical protein